ncbi:Hypothetical predicted protein [Octopus vulgaris]|uniref:Uncharacterized protein n=1 Tax=Octopus vulgaris TaxID=6645 RepID=A0AA36AFJ7_OCTVU|nr:Hypothetical predicted protein [Octopus vulgaris]
MGIFENREIDDGKIGSEITVLYSGEQLYTSHFMYSLTLIKQPVQDQLQYSPKTYNNRALSPGSDELWIRKRYNSCCDMLNLDPQKLTVSHGTFIKYHQDITKCKILKLILS